MFYWHYKKKINFSVNECFRGSKYRPNEVKILAYLINGVMLMATHFILKTAFWMKKQVFHTNSICLVKFAVQFLCRTENVLRQVLSECVSRNSGAMRSLQRSAKRKKNLHCHTSTLFASSSPFKTCTLEISRRYVVHNDIIVLLVCGMCAYKLLPSMKLLASYHISSDRFR